MQKSQPATPFEKLHIVSFVRQTEVWLIWLLYSIVFTGLVLVLRFSPMWLISMVWWIIFGLPFLQFCLNIVEATAMGQQHVPPLTAAGLKDARVFSLVLVSIVMVSIHALAVPPYLLLADALILLVGPAIFASIAMRHSMATTLNPLFIARFLRQLGAGFPGLRVLATGALLFLLLVVQPHVALFSTGVGNLLLTITTVYLLLLLSRCTGALLHARRIELGLKTMHSEEQASDQAREAERRARLDFLAPVLDHARAGRQREAWALLESRLKQDRYATEHLFFEELRAMTDRTLAHKLAQGYIKRLVDSNTEQAWRVYEEIYTLEQGNYRLESGETVIRLAETAGTDPRRRIILDTLKYFDDDFPQHPRSRQALLLAADLACHFNEIDLANTLFRKVRTRAGLVHASTFQRVQNLLDHRNRDDT